MTWFGTDDIIVYDSTFFGNVLIVKMILYRWW